MPEILQNPLNTLTGSWKPIRLQIGDWDFDIHPLLVPLIQKILSTIQGKAIPKMEIIKAGIHRIVYRLEWEGTEIFVKHHRAEDWITKARNLIRPCKAKSEFQRAQSILGKKIRTITPFGWGKKRGLGSDSVFISLGLENAAALSDYLQTDFLLEKPAFRQKLARSLGEFVAQLHQAGIFHHDFHAGNLMVRFAQENEPIFTLIDLNNVQVGPPLPWKKRLQSLAQFNGWLSILSERTDRLRFWKTYLRVSQTKMNGPFPAQYTLLGQLETLSQQSAQKVWEKRDQQCLQKNRNFIPIRKSNIQGHAVRALDPLLLGPLIQNPDAPFSMPGVKILKHSKSSTAAEWESGTKRYVYKKITVTRWTDPWTSLVRPTPALRSWKMGHVFLDRDLLTPRPLLVLHRSFGPTLWEGFLLTEKIDNALSLNQHLDKLAHLKDKDRRDQLRDLIHRLAKTIQKMHSHNISHRDLKAGNILVQTLGEKPRLWLLDLVGAQDFSPAISDSRRIQNLTRLNVSFYFRSEVTRTDRVRFLRSYFQWNLKGKNSWKWWWKNILCLSLKKIQNNLRRGRIVG